MEVDMHLCWHVAQPLADSHPPSCKECVTSARKSWQTPGELQAGAHQLITLCKSFSEAVSEQCMSLSASAPSPSQTTLLESVINRLVQGIIRNPEP